MGCESGFTLDTTAGTNVLNCAQGPSPAQPVGYRCLNAGCPANAQLTVPGRIGACTCNPGYYGSLTLSASQDWQGSCTRKFGSLPTFFPRASLFFS